MLRQSALGLKHRFKFL